jgi:pimeloyl-ACP methyl ester carboxylesterase
MIAWYMAASWPERVTQLVLMASNGYPQSGYDWLSCAARTPGLRALLRWCTPLCLTRSSLQDGFSPVHRANVTPDLVERYQALALALGNRGPFVQILAQDGGEERLGPLLKQVRRCLRSRRWRECRAGH